MKKETPKVTAARMPGLLYAKAYRTQHTLKDDSKAVVLYKGIIAAYPHSREAGYARSQIRGIEGKEYPTRTPYIAQPPETSSLPETPIS